MKFIGGLITGVVLALLAGFIMFKTVAADMMFVERVSPYDYNTTVQKVKQSYLDNKWQVLSVKDSNAGFVKKGKEPIGKVTNMKVCAGQHAYKLLKSDANKHIITMMPCGVGIYEEDGEVHVTTMNLGLMKGMFSGTILDVMSQVEADTNKVMSVLKQ